MTSESVKANIVNNLRDIYKNKYGAFPTASFSEIWDAHIERGTNETDDEVCEFLKDMSPHDK